MNLKRLNRRRRIFAPGRVNRHDGLVATTNARLVRWSFPAALAIGALAIQITGLTVNYVIFSVANANYADFASPADLLVAGFKIPLALVFGLAVAVYYWLILNLWRNEEGVIKKIILGLVTFLTILIVLSGWFGASAGSAIANVGRPNQPNFWGRLTLGIMPFVEITSDKPEVSELFKNTRNIQLLGRAGDFFLFAIDGNAAIVSRSTIIALEPRATSEK